VFCLVTEGLACLCYRVLIPNGNERPLWDIGDDQPAVTSKLSLAHVSLSTPRPRWHHDHWRASGLPLMAFQWVSDKAGLVCHKDWKMWINLALYVICSKVISLLWVLSKISLTSPLQKKRKGKKAQYHLTLCRKDSEDKVSSGRENHSMFLHCFAANSSLHF
jgi:hypothetical protein